MFDIGGHWVRTSTKSKDLLREYKFRQKNQLPVVRKRFADVASLAVAGMREAITAGIGKSVYLRVAIQALRLILEDYPAMPLVCAMSRVSAIAWWPTEERLVSTIAFVTANDGFVGVSCFDFNNACRP